MQKGTIIKYKIAGLSDDAAAGTFHFDVGGRWHNPFLILSDNDHSSQCSLLPRVNTPSISADSPWKVRLAIAEICSLRAAGKTSQQKRIQPLLLLIVGTVSRTDRVPPKVAQNLQFKSAIQPGILYCSFIPFLLFPLSFLQASVVSSCSVSVYTFY